MLLSCFLPPPILFEVINERPQNPSSQSRLGKMLPEASVHLRKCLSLAGLDMTFLKRTKNAGEGGTSIVELDSHCCRFNCRVFLFFFLSLRFKRSAPLSTDVPEPLYTCASLTNWDTGSWKTALSVPWTPALWVRKKKVTKPLIIACKLPCIEKDLSKSQTSAHLPYKRSLQTACKAKNKQHQALIHW